jgi:hypothetical protein
MEDAPTFDAAVERLRRFLDDQGWPSTLVWRLQTDIVRGRHCDVVVRRRSEAAAVSSARAHYETGRRHGVGIALQVACDLEGVACATVYWTTDMTEAEYRMMPARGLKLGIVTPHRRGRAVGRLKWWLAKRKARASSPDAAQPDVAVGRGSRLRSEPRR